MFNLVIYGTDSLAAAGAAAKAYQLIDTLNLMYSDYLPDSELNRLCAAAGLGQWTTVSTPLYNIIRTAYDAAAWSGGSFDITAGPLVRLWRQARKQQKLPSHEDLLAAKRLVGYRYICFDGSRRAIRLTKKGMQLDLGGIAKGETGQRVINQLQKSGFPYALLDAGGDIVCSGTPPGIDGWTVAINMPGSESLMSRPLLLQNGAVTTSGDLYQYVVLQGTRYSHVVNPLTGYAITNNRNVTVVSKSGVVADWLTKACTILPVADALKLVKRFRDTEVQIACIEKGQPVFYRSILFDRYFLPEKR